MFMVVLDSTEYTWMMGLSPDCDGALAYTDIAPALFGSRQEAQRAIAISVAHAKLCAAQGKPVNTDFTTERSRLKIIRCVVVAERGGA